MLITSFYTPEPFYRTCALIFQTHHSCLADRCEVHLREGNGKWRTNLLQKPEFVLEAWRNQGDDKQPLVWMDIDCLLVKPISVPETTWDVGIIRGVRAFPVSSAFLLVNTTEAAHAFLRMWKTKTEKSRGDHISICRTANRPPKGCTVVDMTRQVTLLQNGIKGALKQLTGTLKCPHCQARYWAGMKDCTVGHCKQCTRIIGNHQWR